MTTNTAYAEQLTLLPDPSVPARFHLDEATRRRGLSHVAEIKARLELVSEARDAARAGTSPTRRLRLTPDLVVDAATSVAEPVSIAPSDPAQHAA